MTTAAGDWGGAVSVALDRPERGHRTASSPAGSPPYSGQLKALI